MSDVFPELKEHAMKIREIIADEEASFGRTLTKVCPLISFILVYKPFHLVIWWSVCSFIFYMQTTVPCLDLFLFGLY